MGQGEHLPPEMMTQPEQPERTFQFVEVAMELVHRLALDSLQLRALFICQRRKCFFGVFLGVRAMVVQMSE